MSPTADHPPLIVVMGVAGSGKTTFGEALGARLGVRYSDADGFHPQANVDKMAAGHPLTDDDRWPWLDRIGEWLASYSGGGAIVSCSALRRVYRDRIRQQVPEAVFAHLAGPQQVVQQRMERRCDHFMPASLVQSQYDTLEPLEPDERGVALDLDQPLPAIVDDYVAWTEQHRISWPRPRSR